MKTTLRLLFAATMLSGLCLAGCGRNNSQKQYDPAHVQFQAQYNTAFEGCLYPSLVLGLSFYTADTPADAQLFSVSATSPANVSVIRITIDSSKLNYVTILQEEMPKKGERYTFHPQLKWKYDNLYNTRKQGNIDLTFTCYINDEEVDVKNLRLNYRSANECVLTVRDSNQHSHDLRWVFAGYVNEDHPYIDSILARIIDEGVINRFVGYQMGEKMVEEQVFAFWYDALCRGITYSSISCTSNPSKNTNVQRIRFFDEVYNSRQANCIDACVFFASLMRKVGLKPVIFIEPCHAYLGYYTDTKRKKTKLLETTITSWVNFPEIEKHLTKDGRMADDDYHKVKKYLSEKSQHKYESGKMAYADVKLEVARTLFKRASEYNDDNHKDNLKNYADTTNTKYKQLDIEMLRKYVQPIN